MKHIVLTGILCVLLFWLNSCNQYTSSDFFYSKSLSDSLVINSVQTELQTANGLDTLIGQFSNQSLDSIQLVIKTAYASGSLLWQDAVNKTPHPSVNVFLGNLGQAKKHGLPNQAYKYQEIDSLYRYLYAPRSPVPDNYQTKISELDVLLSTSFLCYASDLLHGSIKPRGVWEITPRQAPLLPLLQKASESKQGFNESLKKLSPNDKAYLALQEKLGLYQSVAVKGGWKIVKANESASIAQRLQATADLAAGKNDAASLKKAVETYQARHGLPITGRVDNKTLKVMNVPVEKRVEQIQLNLERYRWLPGDLGERYVWVNLPEYKIRVFDQGKEVAEIVGVVGAPTTESPILVNKPMKNIIFSPTWTLPTSIAKEEMEYILRNPAVLIVADVDVWVDGKKVSDPRDVDWKNTNLSRVRMRQRPKKTNSMGKAKFMFANGHSIYLHDTPNQQDFKINYRAQSHGCIRVSEPQRLAEVLMQGSDWDAPKIKTAMNSGKERYVNLPTDTKVHLFYLTAWVDDAGTLQFRSDIYGHDRRQLKQLQLL
ncbi:MAG: L,D-transpeptidase family protein [Chitinophagales bacterium]